MSYRPKLSAASIELLARIRAEEGDQLHMELQLAASADEYIETLIAELDAVRDCIGPPGAVEYSVALRPEPAPPKNPPREVFKYGRAGRRA